jgi:steroid 5-alpha reductase family enzyme
MAILIIGVTLLLCLVMAGAWLVQRALDNAGWVDAVWSFGLGLAGVIYALAPEPGIVWPGARQILLALLVGGWSLRLGLHLFSRTGKLPEDVRYAELRREWGPSYQARLFGFLQIQAAASALLALSVLAAASNPAPLGLFDFAGVALFILSVAGEGVADAQLQRFRADPANRGKICEAGLWRLSRHPNYFFEWLGWLAYPLLALGPDFRHGFGWLAFLGPVLMYALLVHVSGIPPLERQMLKSRGEAYRQYQSRTRAFLPLPLSRSP